MVGGGGGGPVTFTCYFRYGYSINSNLSMLLFALYSRNQYPTSEMALPHVQCTPVYCPDYNIG